MRIVMVLFGLLFACQGVAESLAASADPLIDEVMAKVVVWRRDIHEHPELSNREFRTAALVAEHLRTLGIEVETEVAHTGVVGTLRGAADTPVVALRADMDGLPVTEMVDLPFASKARGEYRGEEVGVMHACGHDTHVAMLMGVAEVLSKMRHRIPGTVKFVFQPAEEGTPPGESGGASLMIEEGAIEGVDAIFGLHVFPSRLGSIGYRPGQLMASSDRFEIFVEGTQTHGAMPWNGVDPIVVSSQIVLGLQTIVSRQVDATLTPSIISVGRFSGGVRNNIIPDRVELEGTIRTFDESTRAELHARIRRTATSIAESAGANAKVVIHKGNPVTANDVALTRMMIPTLEKVALNNMAMEIPRVTTAEDFSHYQLKVPGLFFFLGVADPDDPNPAPNHSPYFYADERALPVGVRAMTYLALDYLTTE